MLVNTEFTDTTTQLSTRRARRVLVLVDRLRSSEWTYRLSFMMPLDCGVNKVEVDFGGVKGIIEPGRGRGLVWADPIAVGMILQAVRSGEVDEFEAAYALRVPMSNIVELTR